MEGVVAELFTVGCLYVCLCTCAMSVSIRTEI